MYGSLRKRAKKAGQAPGALVHIGDQKTEQIIIRLIDYDDSGYFLERQTDDLAELTAAIETPTITWINVIGLHQVEMIDRIGQAFGIHPLLLEDILNTDQRPKLEHYERYTYLILKMLHWNEEQGRVETEQISMVLGRTFVLTFQEQEQDVFDPLRQRIRQGKGRIRQTQADYLAYALLDSVVDHYFLILERLGDRIEALEDEVAADPTPDTLKAIHKVKREILFLRKSIWPLRELLRLLQHGDSDLFQATTLIYLRDVYEHTVHIVDTVEVFREMLTGMLDLYLSSVSNKMNEVMKVLTVIATLFIPLTFITSLYGMNFHNMPELQWRWGYSVVWLALLFITVAMLVYFKRRDWL